MFNENKGNKKYRIEQFVSTKKICNSNSKKLGRDQVNVNHMERPHMPLTQSALPKNKRVIFDSESEM